MSSKKTSKQNTIGKVQKLSAGIRQYLSGKVLTLAGKSVTAEDLLKGLDGYVAQLNSTDAAHASWIAEVQTTAALETGEINPQIEALESYLRSLYGATSQTLVSFGLTPKKAPKRTSAEKAETAAKSAATRVARHTLGPKQKASIHGVVAPPASEPSIPSNVSNPQQPTPNTDAIKRNS
jgi:hypothetical protein